MDYLKWKDIFEEIKESLNLNFESDFQVAKILDNLLDNKSQAKIEDIKNLLEGREVFIFGAGPTLEEKIMKYKGLFFNKILICADGATSALINHNILPTFIVTDLDGNIQDQIYANKKGSIVIIHAHGDNKNKIEKYIDQFEGQILGTTQTDPTGFKNLFNFGGFTDGDRAVFLAEHFKAKKINLIGFDFDSEIGKYSYTSNDKIEIKLRKLKWCKELIANLSLKNNSIKFF
jgi:hypothetical protein